MKKIAIALAIILVLAAVAYFIWRISFFIALFKREKAATVLADGKRNKGEQYFNRSEQKKNLTFWR